LDKIIRKYKNKIFSCKKITIIADREFDIYEEWDRIPDKNINLLIRASKDRKLSNNKSLFKNLEKVTPSFCYNINLSEITNKREKRVAKVEVSYSQVEILKPASCKDKEAKKSINLNAILVKEITDGLTEKDRILWKLLTTHEIVNAKNVHQIISWYSKRWLIEQLFRTLKTQGINIKSSLLESAESLIKLSIAGVISTIKTMQLVQARDGNNARKINDVFQEEDFEVLKNLNKNLEGKTEKQKIPIKRKV
jgi:hypothetical protein